MSTSTLSVTSSHARYNVAIWRALHVGGQPIKRFSYFSPTNQNPRLSSCSLLSVNPVQPREVDMRGQRDGYPHTPCPCVTLRRHLSLLAPFSRWNSARFKQNGSPNLAELAMTAAHASRTEQGLSRQLCNSESRLLSVTYEAQAAAVFIRTGRGRHRKRTQSHCAHFSRVLNHNAIK